MDPDETLRQLRERIAYYDDFDAHGNDPFERRRCLDQVRVLADDLDTWLSDGGALPRAWAPSQAVGVVGGDGHRSEGEVMDSDDDTIKLVLDVLIDGREHHLDPLNRTVSRVAYALRTAGWADRDIYTLVFNLLRAEHSRP